MISAQLATQLVVAFRLGEHSETDPPIDDAPSLRDEEGGDPRQVEASSDETLLARLLLSGQVAAAAHAEYLSMLAEADRRGVVERVHGMSAASWLAAGTTHSAKTARAEVHLAGLVAAVPVVADALACGRLSVEQASVVCHGLALIDHLDRRQRDLVAAHLVDLAGEFGPAALRRLVNHAVVVVCPEIVEQACHDALERADRQAHRDRHLSLRRDPDGNVLLAGKLPALAGELLIGHLGAIANHTRAVDATHGIDTSRGQALADALVLAVGHHADCEPGPTRGGDHARLVITLDYAALATGTGAATLAGTDHQVSAAHVRHLACTAGLLPVVLDGASQPLDVGREQRFFTPAQRAALAVRDHGCAFPGCDRPPADCHAHHRTPWSVEGPTDVANGVLLCPHHHQLVEPDPRRPEDANWRIDLDPRGNPQFTSPANRTGQRITRQHHRYRT